MPCENLVEAAELSALILLTDGRLSGNLHTHSFRQFQVVQAERSIRELSMFLMIGG